MSKSSRVQIDIFAQSNQGNSTHAARIGVDDSLLEGTDIDQADVAYYDTLTIPYASTPATLDLSDGSLVTIDGNACAMKEAVAIIIKNGSDDNDATVSFDFGAGDYVWTEPLYRGGTIVKYAPPADGYPTLGGDAPHITIDIVDGTNVEIEVLVLGRSLS
jgi:hypothetical protein